MPLNKVFSIIGMVSLVFASSASAYNFLERDGSTGTVGGCSDKFTENLAYDKPAATIPAELTEHSKTMCKMIIEIVPEKVYLAWGYALANLTLVVGDDGVILIDPPDSIEATQIAYKDLRAAAKTDKPVTAVIYTHSHPDHFPGVKAVTNEEDVAAGKVKIIAHELFMQNIAEQNSILGPILGVRSAFSAGDPILSPGPEGRVNAGLGPLFFAGTLSLIPPTDLIPDKGRTDFEISGVKMEIRHTPGDIYDNVTIWFPEWKMYHFAEVLQGENFPNLHTIRGTRYRDPERWYKSIDAIRDIAKDGDILIGSHGRPVFGNEESKEVLTSYRDAIQFTHDQTVRYMNHGLIPDQLVEVVKLPPHLAEHPWLGEFYGTVNHSVRQIYVGLIGFWQGDMTAMAKPDYHERAASYVRMMGGRQAILDEARQAIDAGNPGWAADILTWPIAADPGDMPSRILKAEALRVWAYKIPNINWRHNALIGAKELETEGTLPMLAESAKAIFGSPDVLEAIPAAQVLENMKVQLKAEETLGLNLTLGFELTDLNEAYALEIRKGIVEFHNDIPPTAEIVLELTERDVINDLTGQKSYLEAIGSGLISLKQGSTDDLKIFLDKFELPNPGAIRLVAR